MLKNYFLIAWRNLSKNKLSTFVNLMSLSIGMSCCMLILIYIKDETNYNKFNSNYDSVYRIDWTSNKSGTVTRSSITPVSLGRAVLEEVPQVKSLTQLYQRSGGMEVQDEGLRKSKGKKFQEQNVYFSDNSLFTIFSIPFLNGDSKNALSEPNTVVITDEMALKYFGTQDVLGKFLFYDAKITLQVSGIVKKMPTNSDLQFDFLIHFESLYSVENNEMSEFIKTDWTYNPVMTYCLLENSEEYKVAEASMNEVLRKRGTKRNKQMNTVFLQPLKNIHLYASDIGGNPSTSSYIYIYIFGAIALLILLIANVNFINLAIARAGTRVREVGMRKVLGAHRIQLVIQFLSETLLLSGLAFLLALAFTQVSLPALNELTDKSFNWRSWFNSENILLFSFLFLITALCSGCYPAFFISRFNTILSLKGKSGEMRKKNLLRKTLLVAQFSISIVLIIGAIIIYQQLNFVRNKPLGFQKEYMLNVPIFGSGSSSLGYGVDGTMRKRMNTFCEELKKYSKIKEVTAASALPGQWYIPGLVIPEGFSETDNIFIPWLCVDYNFISTFKIPIVAGRDFSKETGTDHLTAFILNETAVKNFGWKDPQSAIGKTFIRGQAATGKKGQVIGVVKDHHFSSLAQAFQPLLMDVSVARFSVFAINIQADHIPATLDYIQKQWDVIFPERVFEYTFLDNDINAQYNDNEKLSKMISYFAAIAILLSCLGLFSLSSFLTMQRTREIGIRKVLGSGVSSILILLSMDFFTLVFISFVLASPLAFYGANLWLQDYYYRISIQWWVFALAGLSVLMLTGFTIILQGLKVATVNPIKSLRTE